MNSIRRIATASAVLLALSVPAAARQASSVTQADVQRLQDNIYLAERDIQQVRSRDGAAGVCARPLVAPVTGRSARLRRPKRRTGIAAERLAHIAQEQRQQ